MITSPFGIAHKPATAIQAQGTLPGQGPAGAQQSSLAKLPGVEASEQKLASEGLDFEGLLKQAMPDGLPHQPPYDGVSVASGLDMGDAALADLGTELRALFASLVTDSDETPELDAVKEFLGILHQFDLETGADATGILTACLARLDEQGLATLEYAALDPVALIAALAQLADIPEQTVQAALPLRPFAPALSMAKPVPSFSNAPMSSVREVASAFVEASALPPPSAAVRGGIPAIFGRESQADARSLVLNVIAQTVAGAEREGQFLSAPAAESRHVTGSLADALRPMAAPSQAAPATGFARNLVQQIRTASLSEGQTRIALAPRGLGEIEIDLRPDEAGRLRIVLRAENPAVLQALRSDRDGLLTVLSESGAATEDADLEFEDFSRRSSRQAEETTEAPFGAADPEAEDPPQVNPSPLQQSLADGALDILT